VSANGELAGQVALVTGGGRGIGAGIARELAAAGARVADRVLLALAFALPFAVVIALINPLVVRDGLTVIARFGSVPVLGRLDVTAEATAYGGVLALRALVVIGCFALHSAAVDPDDLLRAFRRVSFRSALAAALAVRPAKVYGYGDCANDPSPRCWDLNRSVVASGVSAPETMPFQNRPTFQQTVSVTRSVTP
jgi:hypothetical protein